MNGETRKAPMSYGRKADFLQYFYTAVASLAVVPAGMTLGYSAVALPHLLEPNDTLYLTVDEGSWVASLAIIATPIGCLLCGPFVDKFGRKQGLIHVQWPALIGWVLIAVNPLLTQLLIGRVITGIACGMAPLPATMFIAESTTPALRGVLTIAPSVGISLGISLVYIFGLVFQENWQLIAGVCSVFPVLSVLLMYFVLPESPVWLMGRNKTEAAAQSLRSLRGVKTDEMIENELDELRVMAVKERGGQSKPSLLSALKGFSRPEAYKPFFILNSFFFFQQMTGIFIVISYAVSIVKEAGVASDPFVAAVLIGLTRLFFTLMAAWMSRRFGRRPTALISGAGMAVSMLTLGSHLLYKFEPTTLEIAANVTNSTQPPDVEDASLVPVVSLLLYILFSTLGFLTLPWSMIGELYPSQIRGVGGGITVCVTYILCFFLLKLYPTMVGLLETHGVFFFYGSVAVLGTIFVYFYLPETQGKSFIEIQAYFNKKKNPRTAEEEVLNGRQMIVIVPKQST